MADVTLRTLMKEHPEWADLPIAVYREDGSYDYVGGSGAVYHTEDGEDEILVFTGN